MCDCGFGCLRLDLLHGFDSEKGDVVIWLDSSFYLGHLLRGQARKLLKAVVSK